MRRTLSVTEFAERVDEIFAESKAELQRTRSLVARLTLRDGEDRLDDLCDTERHLFL
jgi:hypothetical protein